MGIQFQPLPQAYPSSLQSSAGVALLPSASCWSYIAPHSLQPAAGTTLLPPAYCWDCIVSSSPLLGLHCFLQPPDGAALLSALLHHFLELSNYQVPDLCRSRCPSLNFQPCKLISTPPFIITDMHAYILFFYCLCSL